VLLLVAQGHDGEPLSLFAALVLGLVEGLTEFLPVSSTGHLIVAERMLGIGEGTAENTFTVGIQIGAISAILLLYWRRLWTAAGTVLRPSPGQPNLLWQIVLAAMPAAMLGLWADNWIDAHLFSPLVVASTMVLGGGLLLWLERHLHRQGDAGSTLPMLGYRTAVYVGLFQCLALIPGTSRSAATIAGAMLLGLSRTAAAEFSFLVGLPILYGAGLLKLWKHGHEVGGTLLWPFLVATLVSFLSALVVVRPFVAFLRRHSFAPFAWDRIGAGALLFGLCFAGYL
jgi:undecaprenyl-diphosphatase